MITRIKNFAIFFIVGLLLWGLGMVMIPHDPIAIGALVILPLLFMLGGYLAIQAGI